MSLCLFLTVCSATGLVARPLRLRAATAQTAVNLFRLRQHAGGGTYDRNPLQALQHRKFKRVKGHTRAARSKRQRITRRSWIPRRRVLNRLDTRKTTRRRLPAPRISRGLKPLARPPPPPMRQRESSRSSHWHETKFYQLRASCRALIARASKSAPTPGPVVLWENTAAGRWLPQRHHLRLIENGSESAMRRWKRKWRPKFKTAPDRVDEHGFLSTARRAAAQKLRAM